MKHHKPAQENRNAGGINAAVRRVVPLPEWLERAWRGDRSMLPKRPPGRVKP